MKKIRLTAVAVLLAVSAFAAQSFADQTWVLKSPDLDPTVAANYQAGVGSGCSTALDRVCYIVAPASGAQPILSATLLNHITNPSNSYTDVKFKP